MLDDSKLGNLVLNCSLLLYWYICMVDCSCVYHLLDFVKERCMGLQVSYCDENQAEVCIYIYIYIYMHINIYISIIYCHHTNKEDCWSGKFFGILCLFHWIKVSFNLFSAVSFIYIYKCIVYAD